ncbi:hypothetical protein MTBBW1_1220007 [Desulfamplus magnetovallimortis]|uniref:Response regulatory domain-containing protein n=1 Tax=Desulfamplus magnetovallimortis TaxID=1246637 RepID=A0A1W1H6C7_9BACT|nr:flagellar assembly protein A [Desulfamplus magnetovallimortis]SLM28007.1 hypothetical protein MTBBW1_1220007 [Desulfamplus magnetovallimortis]
MGAKLDKIERKILIVEHDQALGETMEQILESAGYNVRRVNTSFAALAALEGAEHEPFSVVVSSYSMPRMGGDELMRNACSISPDTQRVMLVNPSEIATVVSAVNRAGIHSCIQVPFQDEIFLAEISQRCDQFDRVQKRERLLKVTRHQNKQFYKMAMSLKEKKEAFSRKISEKKGELQALKNSNRGKNTKTISDGDLDIKNVSLEGPMDSFSPDSKALINGSRAHDRAANGSAGYDRLVHYRAAQWKKKEGFSIDKLLDIKGIQRDQQFLEKEFRSLSFKLKSFVEELLCEKNIRLEDVDNSKFLPIELNPYLSGEQAGVTESTWLNGGVTESKIVNQLLQAFLADEFCKAEKLFCLQSDICVGEEGDSASESESFKIVVSKDCLSASIHIMKQTIGNFSMLQDIMSSLKQEKIICGIEDDTVIEEWLTSSPEPESTLVVARGDAPIQPVYPEIKFYFDVDFLHAGKINSDGTIDFRDRGKIPFVKAGKLLAEKVPLRQGIPGRDIYGNIIEVEYVEDLLFDAGSNTRFSDDGLKIYATADGQPSLSAMGVVAIYPELRIDGDVDYETGNINFNGNLVVSGTIKEGFSVRCANLTVDQIHGAEINITGDLNVSSGIINSHVINVQGNIQTKYINNSRVKAFRDIIVQREIMDSHLFAGGTCINENGVVISSFINAKGGIKAGQVGTLKASASKLEVGTEGLMEMIIAELDERIEGNNLGIKKLKNDIEAIEAEEKMLHEKISNAAYVQDRAQIELRDIQKKLPEMQESNDIQAVRESIEMVKELQERAMEAEEIINDAFARQDNIMEIIQLRQREIEKIETLNKAIVLKKRGIREFSLRTEPKSYVTVKKSITAGTQVAGMKSKIVVSDDRSRCRIHEVRTDEGAFQPVYEMIISDLY